MKPSGIMKNLNWYRLIALITFCLTLTTTDAQTHHTDSTVVNKDGSVAFYYANPKARSVKVICDCRLRRETRTIKRENYHKAKMSKDSTGNWHYTTPPLSPEVYTYQFNVDGRNMPDPTNPDSVRVRTEKLSMFVISGTPQSNLYVTDSLKGRVDTVVYKSPKGGKNRNMLVYTPPQYYNDTTSTYPVLYLIHGLNGNENAWSERGRATQILDNLIDDGRAIPMILVMPDANPECLISQKENVGLVKNILLYPSWNKKEFEYEFKGIDSFLCSKYRFSPVKGGRAAAGLSAGAKQAANLANMYDSTFRYVGLFSPVVKKKQLPHDLFSRYWIGGGVGDLFHLQINIFRKKMQRKHIPYTMYNSIGGHTWRNWRVYFSEFVQTIKF